MRIQKTTNPKISFALIPWFVPANLDRLQIGWELHEMLRKEPDNVFCLIATENGIGQAVLIAYTEENYVWVWQRRIKAGFKYQKFMYDGLVNWSKARGFDRLRCGASKRAGRVLRRRYGFEDCGNNKLERLI